jgi:protein ImuB
VNLWLILFLIMKRILCLWFPNWPVQRRLAVLRVAAQPLVLHAMIGGKPRVVACSRAARGAGVKAGMLLAEAESLCAPLTPTLSPRSGGRGSPIFEEHDPRADRDALREMARRCQRFTPLAAIENTESPDSILLDVTGCGYGFGGLEGLAKTAIAGLREDTRIYHEDTKTRRQEKKSASHFFVSSCLRGGVSFFAIAGLADTVGAAWAVAHYGDGGERVRIVPPGQQEEELRRLPIEALRLPGDAVELLHEFDIRRIEQLLALPRRELPCRFGSVLLHRLDQALGIVPELIEPEPQDDPIQASWPFEPPIADGRLLDQAIGYLLERVLERLRPHALGVQRMLCSLMLANGEPVRIPVGLVRPSATFAHLIDLLRLHLERVRVTAEIAEVSLFVPCVAALEFQQDEMFEEAVGSKPLAPLLERLMSRLGEEMVLHPRLEADPQPEYGWREDMSYHEGTKTRRKEEKISSRVFVSSCLRGETSFLPPHLERRPVAVPVMSVVPGGPPLSFEWKGRSFRIAQAWGPERIETGWWRGDDVRRDYYQVETAGGERFWLFRRLPDEQWFLHGVFS